MFSRALIVSAGVAHLGAAWFSVGHYHADEHHQILEFASALAGKADPQNLAWEHGEKVRSALQPFIARAVAVAAEAAGAASPFTTALLLRMTSAALALAASFAFLAAFLPELKTREARQAAAWTTLLLWALVFVHVRFSSEGWAASLTLLALALWRKSDSQNNPPPPLAGLALAGFIFGLAFLARFQIGFALAGFALWILFVRRAKISEVAALAGGGTVALTLGAFLDWRFYGEPVLSWANYFIFQLENPNATGKSPLYYFGLGAALAPPIGILLAPALACFWIFARRHPLAWTTLPFVLAHVWLENRQARFMFPILPMLPFIAALMWERAGPWLAARPGWKTALRRTAIFSAAANVPLLLFAMLFPASKEVALWRDCILPLAESRPAVLHLRDAGGNRREMILDYYNAGRMEVAPMADEAALAGADFSRRVFYAARKERSEQIRAAGFRPRLECAALPEWVLAFNVNDWTSRASVWRVWEISSAE